MRRRDFLVGLGGSVASSLPAFSQQRSMPVIGYFGVGSPGPFADRMTAFRDGLRRAGFVEGRNVAIEYRYAGGQVDRLPGLAAELVNRRVAVLVATGGTISARAAKAATTAIPLSSRRGTTRSRQASSLVSIVPAETSLA